MSAPHVALVGLPGVGKSTVAGKLAAELELRAVDLDEVVEREAGRSIPEIFEAEGEAGFRRRESVALAAAVAAADTPVVIACGGGAVLDEDNRRLLRDGTRCVWLVATPASLVERLAAESNRPLLQGDVAAELDRLAAAREPLYREVAQVIVDVAGLSEDEVVQAVVAALR